MYSIQAAALYKESLTYRNYTCKQTYKTKTSKRKCKNKSWHTLEKPRLRIKVLALKINRIYKQQGRIWCILIYKYAVFSPIKKASLFGQHFKTTVATVLITEVCRYRHYITHPSLSVKAVVKDTGRHKQHTWVCHNVSVYLICAIPAQIPEI